MNILHYAMREVSGRPGRTALNALGVAIGLALVIVLFSITLAYQQAITFPFTHADIDFTISRPNQTQNASPAGVILPAANQPIEALDIEQLGKIPNVENTLAVLQLWSFDPGQFKVIIGIDPDASVIGPAKAIEWIKNGRAFKTGERGVAMLESHYARFFGAQIGSKIKITGQDFTVVGIFEIRQGIQLTAANIYIPIVDAQTLAKVSPDTFNTVYLQLKDPSLWRQTSSAIKQDFPALAVTSADSALAMSDSMLVLLNRLVWPAAILVILICILFVYRSLAASTWEKVGEIGTQKALGWSHQDIRKALVLELFMQVGLGAVLGLLLGGLGAWLTGGWEVQLPQLGGSAPPLPGAVQSINSTRLPIVFPPLLYLAGFGITLLIGFLVSFILVKKTTSIKPTEAWRSL